MNTRAQLHALIDELDGNPPNSTLHPTRSTLHANIDELADDELAETLQAFCLLFEEHAALTQRNGTT